MNVGKPDITGRNDIEKLLDRFYEKAFADPVIGYLFTDIAKLDLEKHLPVISDFWENILFDSPVYKGQPMQAHLALHELSPLNAAHFDRWISLFNKTVDELFQGPVSEKAKTRALSIATVMKVKILTSGSKSPDNK